MDENRILDAEEVRFYRGTETRNALCDSHEALRAALATERLRAEAAEAERDGLADQVMRVQTTSEYDLGHDHGSAVARKYQAIADRNITRANTAEARVTALTEALREWLDAAEALATCNRAEFIDAQIRVSAARFAARALLLDGTDSSEEPET